MGHVFISLILMVTVTGAAFGYAEQKTELNYGNVEISTKRKVFRDRINSNRLEIYIKSCVSTHGGLMRQFEKSEIDNFQLERFWNEVLYSEKMIDIEELLLAELKVKNETRPANGRMIFSINVCEFLESIGILQGPRHSTSEAAKLLMILFGEIARGGGG